MIKLHLEIEGATTLDTLAKLRCLATALDPGRGADAPSTAADTVQAPASTPASAPTPAASAPVPTPVAPTTAPTPVPTPAAPAAPAPVPTTAAPAPAPAPAPVQGKTYTLDDLARAGSELVDQGKMAAVMDLLTSKYHIQAVTQLQSSDYPAFVADLRVLGANI